MSFCCRSVPCLFTLNASLHKLKDRLLFLAFIVFSFKIWFWTVKHLPRFSHMLTSRFHCHDRDRSLCGLHYTSSNYAVVKNQDRIVTIIVFISSSLYKNLVGSNSCVFTTPQIYFYFWSRTVTDQISCLSLSYRCFTFKVKSRFDCVWKL